MMKMMILAPRRPGLSHVEFRAYVTEVHGPLVKSVPEVAADIRHYHYNFPLLGATDLAFHHPIATHLDIVTQGWFDSREAQLQNMKHPRYLELIRPDEGRFANEAGAVMHYTHEVTIRDSDSILPKYKAFYFRRRRAHLSREAFQQAWRTRFASLLSKSSAFAQVCSKYVQNHTLSEADHPDGQSAKFFDVFDEMFLDGPESLARLGSDLANKAAIASVEEELLEPGFTRCYISETVPNIP